MTTLLDPVCGMTVGESALRADGFDNVAFCSSGCLTTFLADPSAYAPSDEPASDAGHDGHHHEEHHHH